MNSNDPLVSILIPCYNSEKTIGRAVYSALSQTYANIEVIIVDDGSTDTSLSIASKIESQRLRVISQTNKGANAARNLLLREARGEYIQLLDSDDELMPNKVSKAIEVALRYSADVIISDYEQIDQNKSPVIHIYPDPKQVDVVSYFVMNAVLTNSPVIKASTLKGLWFDEQLKSCQEYDFFLRATLKSWCTVYKDNAVGFRRFLTGTNISRNELSVYTNKLQILECLYRKLMSEPKSDNANSHAIKCIGFASHNAGRHLARFRRRELAERAFVLSREISGFKKSFGLAPWLLSLLVGDYNTEIICEHLKKLLMIRH